ncbi:hypothetical protein BRC85_04105 [Halobacteriales archaeon QS_1_69_70]|nr:MAG: hypothetical protein BRC85_04105 [Halobacteriales archaeon QS_1_69_70]
MRRRGFLGGTVAAAVAVAGCLDAGDAGEEPTGDPTAEPTDTPDGRTLEDTAFDVTNVECGSDYGHHDVTTSGDTVTVEGVLDGRDTCYTAELVRGEYVGEMDTLFVEVEARESEDAAACGQCIVEIHYVATFAFDEGTPERVEVEQRGATTSGSSGASGSGSATEPDATRTPTPDPDDY